MIHDFPQHSALPNKFREYYLSPAMMLFQHCSQMDTYRENLQ